MTRAPAEAGPNSRLAPAKENAKSQFVVQILITARSLREVQVELLTQLRSAGLSRAFKASLLREVAQRIVLNAETEGVTS